MAQSLEGQAESGKASIDHVILGIADLDRGVQAFREVTGVEPTFGGEHPGVGTHNALASLGGKTYLELIAPRPGAEVQERWSELPGLQKLTPVGWAAGVDDLEQAQETLRRAGFETTEPTAGSRARPDGSLLEWRTAAIVEPQMDLAPFLIEWSEGSAHPSTTSPEGCRLESLELRTAHRAALTRLVETLGLNVRIAAGREPAMTIGLECAKGRVSYTKN